MFLRDIISWNIKQGYDGYYDLFNGSDPDKVCDSSSVIRGLTRIYEKYDVPTLKDYGYVLGDVDALAEEVSTSLSGSFLGNPIPFNIESASEVLRNNIKYEGP